MPDLSPAPAPGIARFALYVAVVLTVVMVLFPPYTSLNGTEYAFLLTGPEWASRMGSMGDELGLTPRLSWIRLGVQIGAVWAIALGAWKAFAAPSMASPLLLAGRAGLLLSPFLLACGPAAAPGEADLAPLSEPAPVVYDAPRADCPASPGDTPAT